MDLRQNFITLEQERLCSQNIPSLQSTQEIRSLPPPALKNQSGFFFDLQPALPRRTGKTPSKKTFSETVRIKYFLDLLVDLRQPVMLVGSAGCGKTILVNEKLAQLSDNYMVANVPFNYYTTSEMLQKILEKPLEKKAGKNYGPPGNKKVGGD